MGVALENARLFDETKRLLAETDERPAELAVINEIGEALARAARVRRDHPARRRAGPADRSTRRSIFIALHDPATNLISFPYDLDEGDRFHREPMALGSGLTSHGDRDRPTRSGSARPSEQAAAGAIQVGGTDTSSWLGAPDHRRRAA